MLLLPLLLLLHLHHANIYLRNLHEIDLVTLIKEIILKYFQEMSAINLYF